MSRLFKALTGLASLSLLAACGGPGFATGDGEFHSLGGYNTAKVQFEANSCDGLENSYGEFKLEDKYAIDWEHINGVEFEATVDTTFMCFDIEDPRNPWDYQPECWCYEGYQEINFTYESKHDKSIGTGTACVADIGDGSNKGHSGILELIIWDGQFQGYYNLGSTHVTQHGCN